MKKAILSAALLAAITGTAGAQISIAPEVGVAIYNLRGQTEVPSLVGGASTTKSISADPTFGIKGGINVKLGITDRLSVQPGLFFVSKGAKQKTDEDFGLFKVEGETKISVNYLELPINVQYNVHDNGGGNIFVFAGPYLGYAVSGKQKQNLHITTGGVTVDQDSSYNLNIGSEDSDAGLLKQGDDWKAFDYGFQVGAGYTLPMGLYFRAQYQMGLADVQPNNVNSSSNPLFPETDNNTKNWGFAVTVGYWLFNNNK